MLGEKMLHDEWKETRKNIPWSDSDGALFVKMLRLYWTPAGGNGSWPIPRSKSDLSLIDRLNRLDNTCLRRNLENQAIDESNDKLDKSCC